LQLLCCNEKQSKAKAHLGFSFDWLTNANKCEAEEMLGGALLSAGFVT